MHVRERAVSWASWLRRSSEDTIRFFEAGSVALEEARFLFFRSLVEADTESLDRLKRPLTAAIAADAG